MVVVLEGVLVHQLLVRVLGRGIAQHVPVEITEVHDERRHARHERQPIAWRHRLVSEELEERQPGVVVLGRVDRVQDLSHVERLRMTTDRSLGEHLEMR